jgi:hypothetical protein
MRVHLPDRPLVHIVVTTHLEDRAFAEVVIMRRVQVMVIVVVDAVRFVLAYSTIIAPSTHGH